MEKQAHARNYINQTSLEDHQTNFNATEIVYLSIENYRRDLIGYFILAFECNGEDIEFRRIVVDEKHRGIGQQAIEEMEKYCKTELQRMRIWLDVYDDNSRGKHIYEKLGYVKTGEEIVDGRNLLIYIKEL
jgi:RimJ/RimL family protein N-acetyltransferase